MTSSGDGPLRFSSCYVSMQTHDEALGSRHLGSRLVSGASLCQSLSNRRRHPAGKQLDERVPLSRHQTAPEGGTEQRRLAAASLEVRERLAHDHVVEVRRICRSRPVVGEELHRAACERAGVLLANMPTRPRRRARDGRLREHAVCGDSHRSRVPVARRAASGQGDRCDRYHDDTYHRRPVIVQYIAK